MKVAVARPYERVSTDEQALTGFSLSAQQESIEAFCKSQGWRLAQHYVDEGWSAKDMKRPAFQRLLADAEEGDVVVVYKLDRLTRSVRDLDDLLRLFEQRGLWFRSVTEQFDTTTATGRLFIRMVGEFAQWERESIAERSVFGKAKRARSGEWPGGIAPFGYMTVDSDEVKRGRVLKRIVPDPERWHIVPMIFDRYLAGFGTRAIAIWLNEEINLRSRSGRAFTSTTTADILKNPTYCGDVVYGRARKGFAMERIPGAHEPLITRELFAEVQRIFERRKSMSARSATGEFPLAGVARCRECGGTLCSGRNRNQKTKETGKTWRIYRCNNHIRGRRCGDPPLHSVSAEVIEAEFVEKINRIVKRRGDFDRFYRLCEESMDAHVGDDTIENDRLNSDVLECQASIAQWDAKYEKRRMSEDEHEEKTRPHRDRIEAIKARLVELQAKMVAIVPKEAMLAVFQNIIRSWAGLTLQERKMLVQSFVEFVPVDILVGRDRSVVFRHATQPRGSGARQ